jgi:hypothetical protein
MNQRLEREKEEDTVGFAKKGLVELSSPSNKMGRKHHLNTG